MQLFDNARRTGEILKRRLRFRLDRKHFENGARDNHVIFLLEFLFEQKSKMTGDLYDYKFLRRRVEPGSLRKKTQRQHR